MPRPPRAALPRSTSPIRFGVHGPSTLAEGLATALGYGKEEIEYVPYDVMDPFRPLRDGRTDLMTVEFGLLEPDIVSSRPVAFDGRAVLVSAHHPLARHDEVSVEDIAAYDAFACPGAFPPYVWDKIVPPVTPGGVPIRRVHPMTTLRAMSTVLTRTDSVHLSFQSLDAVVPPGIRVVPVHDLPAAPVSLAWLRERRPSPTVAAFIFDAERRMEP
ncbi:LysR substrate-binding domain-containing protein [Streptomyces mangrovisoli]|uniref:LysR family transcriptional regulator n=1 Tax=Streptomyces mangrovisoli TaxID=1428628 RepID=A0A1J4NXF1_9ACTN|nr:LysR substrate-binding domain-containing protein [Streptomyces mangrovisoli]OIJ65814.1 LysR family transcriptional regulator [Streptomyces mangrovisoli]